MLEQKQSGPEYVATRLEYVATRLPKPHDGKACKACKACVAASAKRKSNKWKKQRAGSQGASASVFCECTETALCTTHTQKKTGSIRIVSSLARLRSERHQMTDDKTDEETEQN
jgi:hypothetical protein